MRKLKIILQSKQLLYTFIVFTLIYVGIKVKTIPYNLSILNQNEIEGVVKHVNDSSLVIDDVIVFYNRDIIIGDYVSCQGKIYLPNENTNFYLFNYRRYLASKKIYYAMNGECVVISSSKSIVGNLKYNIKSYFNRFKSKKYLEAFILGETDYIEEDVMNSYMINGINHLFSVSGMHISFIVSILTFIKTKCVIAIILILYLIILGFPLSMTRAVLFYCLILLNKKVGLSTKKIFLYLLMSMLIYNPFYIYNIGFIYSYLISFFLIYYSDLFSSKRYFVNLIKISFIIFLITIPINIQNNYYLNFIAPLLNIAFIPIVTFILFPMSFIIVFLPFLDQGYYIICCLFEKLSMMFSKVDFFIFSFKHMNLQIFILYYIVIIYILNQMKYYHYKKIIIILILLLLHYIFPYFDTTTYVSFFDVGQGDSVLIKYPNNKLNVLIDTGGIYTSKLVKNIIIPSLRLYGINKIDYLIITHGDYDHMGEAINLVNNFKVEKVIFNCGEYNELEQELIKVLDKKKIPYYSCIKELNIDNNKLYFLNNKDYGNENDNSFVIYTELNNYKFLFMGDAGVAVEENLIEKYNLKDIDVLKVGHHGSKTSSSKSFIDEVNPKYSIISVGKNNRYGHPNDSVLNNLKDSKIYRTDQDGSIMSKIKDNKLKVETCTP